MNKFLPFLFVLLVSFQGHAQNNGQIDIYITGLIIIEPEDSAFYILNASLAIVNPNLDDVSFGHSDLCMFKLKVVDHPENVESNYPFACAEALTSETFTHGISNSSAFGGLYPKHTTLIPDGNYSISLDFANFQLNQIRNQYGAIMTVSNGSITNLQTEEVVINPIDYQSSNFLNSSSNLFFFLSIAIIYNKLRDSVK